MKQAGFPLPITATSLCPMIHMTLPTWRQHHALWLLGGCPQADQGPAGCHHRTKSEVTKDGQVLSRAHSSPAPRQEGLSHSTLPCTWTSSEGWLLLCPLLRSFHPLPCSLTTAYRMFCRAALVQGYQLKKTANKPNYSILSFFCKLIFCYFNMLKWLGKGHDKAWQRTATREGQEQNAQGKGSERAFFFKKYLLYKLEYIWSKGAESRTVDSSWIGLGCHWTSGSTRWAHGGIP